MKLAICDDMEMYLEMLKEKINKHLSNVPHEIDEFSSGEELLENFEKGKLYIPPQLTHLHGKIDTPFRQETHCHKIVHPLTKFHKHSLLSLTFCGENAPIKGKLP